MSANLQVPSGTGPLSEIEALIESCVGHLLTAGYVWQTILEKKRVATRFLRWLRQKQVSLADAGDAQEAEFLKHRPVRRRALSFGTEVLDLRHPRRASCRHRFETRRGSGP